MLEELLDNKADIAEMAARAVKDKSLIAGLVEGLTVKNEDYRYNCSKTLHAIVKTHKELIYPYWDALAVLLPSPNSLHKMCALSLLSEIITEDKKKKFDAIFDVFFDQLNDTHVSVAYYTVAAAGSIAKARPELQSSITKRLLSYSSPGKNPVSNELVKAGIIESFDMFFEESQDKEKMLDYAGKQLDSASPKTRKAAKAFLKKRENK